MRDNRELFDYSLEHPEALLDEFYIQERGLIITHPTEDPNKLMRDNREVLENISAYRIAVNQHNHEMKVAILETIQQLMKTPGMNFTEFVSFWPILDVSYSLYASLSDAEQREFLEAVIQKYLEMRHDLYLGHGYSLTALQVTKDSKAHKSSSQLGNSKIAELLTAKGYARLLDLSLEAFNSKDKVFFFSDSDGRTLFQEIISAYQIEFVWSKGKQNKMPDILFKSGHDVYIVEHKHMKEVGGGQNKQVAEVIDFIGFSEEVPQHRIHYVTFMDGRYFHLFTRVSERDGKIVAQIRNIRNNLQTYPDNYFVNTAGFRELLDQIP